MKEKEKPRLDIPFIPDTVDYQAAMGNPDIGARLSLRLARAALVLLAHPTDATTTNARRIGMTRDALLTARLRIIELLGPFHPVSVALHPERAALARLDVIPPCPRCGLRHVQLDCYRLTIDDYAMMRTS